jgi:hypothetical protein
MKGLKFLSTLILTYDHWQISVNSPSSVRRNIIFSGSVLTNVFLTSHKNEQIYLESDDEFFSSNDARCSQLNHFCLFSFASAVLKKIYIYKYIKPSFALIFLFHLIFESRNFVWRSSDISFLPCMLQFTLFNPLKPGGNYMYHLVFQSVVLHFVFMSLVWF